MHAVNKTLSDTENKTESKSDTKRDGSTKAGAIGTFCTSGTT
jgi:hypothetical protein